MFYSGMKSVNPNGSGSTTILESLYSEGLADLMSSSSTQVGPWTHVLLDTEQSKPEQDCVATTEEKSSYEKNVYNILQTLL